MKKKILIIGGVAGGASTAARLRRIDEKAQIIIFERGKNISFANCGLPYYIGNVIKERENLLLQTPESMGQRFDLDIRVQHVVTAINRDEKTLNVHDIVKGRDYKEKYDTLVISTGSSPVRPPIPGIDAPNIFTLWNIPDTDAVKSYMDIHRPQKAVVVGCGFIGIEMAENLHEQGLDVHMVDIADQVLPSIDFEMAQYLHRHIEGKGVKLNLEDPVDHFVYENNVTTVITKSGKALEADIVMLSIGVRPNSELAKDAGLELNEMGGIKVSSRMLTSDPDIYAVGDVAGVHNPVSGNENMIPLAGPANKQGRICADNICGMKEHYEGTLGTNAAKVFDLDAASTGLNERSLQKNGKKYKKDYHAIHLHPSNHAGYYPGSSTIHMKLLFSPGEGKILGAQAIGNEGTVKRIDVISAVMQMNGTVYDLKKVEHAYAPPYSSAKDPVNMAGFLACNILEGNESVTQWHEIGKLDPEHYTVLDVRIPVERVMGYIPGSINIPVDELRENLNKLDKSKTYIVTCAVGIRAWIAVRILMQNGFRASNLSGGFTTYGAAYYDKQEKIAYAGETESLEGTAEKKEEPGKSKTVYVDACGLQCPGPVMKLYSAINQAQEGDIVEIKSTDMGFPEDLEAWCRRTGNTLLHAFHEEDYIKAQILKGRKITQEKAEISDTAPGSHNKSMVVFSGDLDKAIAAFIIANGAAAMGRKVTLFFTFWGLNILRKSRAVRVKKNFIERMFGIMMPRGSKKLSLSKMNMGGMGSRMIRMVMKKKNVTSLEELIRQAMDNGVEIIACTMSMDIMGIKKEELLEGIKYAGVANFLGAAEESDTTLFI